MTYPPRQWDTFYPENTMAVSENDAATVLVKCGRHCCICRRFDPLRLQVHHIVPMAGAGTDDLDNLIAVCLTCHSDVHTKTPFTRRFTVQELKGHRDGTYALVAEGKLAGAAVAPGNLDIVLDAIARALPAPGPIRPAGVGRAAGLGSVAVQLLVKAAQSARGYVEQQHTRQGAVVIENEVVCEYGNPRKQAEFRDAIEQLVRSNLVEKVGYEGKIFRVTHRGYLFADQVMAAATQDQEPDIHDTTP
jgi:hypothetical protein